jgi:death-on-curing protein
MRFISLDELLVLHRLLLEQSGGMAGIRDLAMLESAAAQPFMTFGGQDLYPTMCDKAAALCFSLVMNHPFIDGNKRIGHAAMELFLVLNGHELCCPVAEQEQQILQLAAGRMKREEFTGWIRMHTVLKGDVHAAQDAANGMTPIVGPIVALPDCPDFIGNARVVCYTPIDLRHRHTRKTKQIVDGTLLGPAAGLAICDYEDGGSTYYYLFGCNKQWDPVCDTWHQSVQDAMRQAEFEYEGVNSTWCFKPQ